MFGCVRYPLDRLIGLNELSKKVGGRLRMVRISFIASLTSPEEEFLLGKVLTSHNYC